MGDRFRTHGHSQVLLASGKIGNSPTYKSWSHMLSRCQNPKTRSYPDYGGRGIAVCDRWQSFEAFLEDMGEAPPGMTIERIENHKGYEPGNCRWATRAEQNRNTRQNRMLTYKGETKCLMEWSRITGIHFQTLIRRLERWSVEKAFETPIRPLKKRAS
jgi:hypothetical protein